MSIKHLIRGVTILQFLIVSLTLSAQNYIYNPGFEMGDQAGADGAGTSTDLTYDYLLNWKRANNDCYHSPDWWRKGAPMYNFWMPGVQTADDPFPILGYDEIFAHGGYGMVGLGRYELVQQKYNHNGLTNTLDNTPWTTITLKFWMRTSNKIPLDGNTQLKVFLAKKKMKYKHNNPVGMSVNGQTVDCNSSFCSNKYRKYKSNTKVNILTIPSSAFGTTYPRGEWHQVTHTFVAPNKINKLDWIVFDLRADGSPGSNICQDGGYLFIDDMELLIGCDDECSRTDGPIGNVVLGNTINATNAFAMALPGPPGSPLPLSNINKLRLEVFANNGSITVFDETVECLNGIDHVLYWDGTNALGSPLANAIYQYRITVDNDCGQQQFTGSLLKLQDYAGPNTTNFDEPCFNGINLTPEPCCYEDIYENNKTLIGVDPGWSEFIVARNIWACTAQPDFSDEVKVEDGGKVLYQAGNQITLREGFNTENGAVFCAQIKPCRFDGNKNPQRLGFVEEELEEEEEATVETNLSYKLYPNPTATGVFYMDVENNSTASYVEVLNLMGTVVHTSKLGASTKMTIDISNYAKGIYLVRVIDGDHSIVQKIIYQ